MARNIIEKTNAEWKDMAVEYKETRSEEILTDMFFALKPLAENIGLRLYRKYKHLGVDMQDFVDEAEFTIFDAIEKYDPEKGNLPAMLKQHITWKISDNIVRPLNTKKGKSMRTAIRFDAVVGHDGYTMLDAVESELAVQSEDVFEDVIEEDKVSFVTQVEELLQAFAESVKQGDSELVNAVFNVIMDKPHATAQVVNKELYAMFPEVAKATLRKRKGRALDKFTQFAKLNGFNSTDMSQF